MQTFARARARIGQSRADLNAALRWVLAITVEQPKIDKLILTDVFLKYKGVSAGEIDWRPTGRFPKTTMLFECVIYRTGNNSDFVP
jgi:hypothetical protein